MHEVFYSPENRVMYLNPTWRMDVCQRLSTGLWPCTDKVLSMVVPKSTKFVGTSDVILIRSKNFLGCNAI
jgi:hypothetical protein